MVDAVLFDLDGTLWDACDSVTASWNRTLAPYGYGPYAVETVRGVMGCTGEDIARRFFADRPLAEGMDIIGRCAREENPYLREHGGILFPQVRETLAQLSARYALAIVSNCLEGYIEAFLAYHDLARYFVDTACYGQTGLVKGETIRLVVQRNRLASPVYVGDTQMDADAAALAGIPFVFARYGFGQAEDYAAAIDRFDELPAVVAALDGRETE